MKEYTRPFVTPLRTSNDDDVRLLGTGSYVLANDQRILVTCEHVIRKIASVEHQFWGRDAVYRVQDPFTCDVPLDVAFAPIRDDTSDAEQHEAQTLLLHDFAARHEPLQDELLFFRGFA